MKRQMAFDETGNEYLDNGERAIFFARGVLETVKKLRWSPDIIQCQGWMASLVPLYIKTAYRDEPAFTDTKVITSLFGSQLKGDLGENFKKNIVFRNTKLNLLKNYSDKFDFNELMKLAIDYSDGVVEATQGIDASLVEHAKAKNLPLMPYSDKDFAETYKPFYDIVAPNKD